MNSTVAGGEAGSAYFGEEHELLRAQIRRFVNEEIKPQALHGNRTAWCRARCCVGWANSAFSASVIPRNMAAPI